MAIPLFSRQPAVLGVAYADLKRQALEEAVVLVGTPGSVTTRIVSGRPYLHRQFYDANGAKCSEYLGAADDPEVVARAETMRERIARANGMLKDARLLASQGYVRADARTGAIVAALANHGLFRAGARLVGSHAYGVLLNDAGVRAVGFATEDVDIARADALSLAVGAPSFEAMLATSLVKLVAVPALERKRPSTSWKPPGHDRLRVDLLTPTRGKEVTVRAIPELGAHATALPYLGYLLEEGQPSVLLARDGVVPVSVPSPARFVWHKALISQLRRATNEKRDKDLTQAAVLAAAIVDEAPDALAEAFAVVPASARRATRAGAKAMIAKLAAHPRAVEAVLSVLE